MYSYITSIDDELLDVFEDGPSFEVEEEGMVADRKKLIATQKKVYKKHHILKGILVEALLHGRYMKIRDMSTAKAIFPSLCFTYERNQQVKKAKENQLVH